MSRRLTVAAVTMLLLGGVATQQVWVRREALDSLAALERDTARLQPRLLAEEERIAGERLATSAITPPQSAASRSTPSTGDGIATSRSAVDERIVEGRAFLKAHPEVRTALIAFYTATLRRTYADLITTMGLSEEQTEQFIAIEMSTRGQIVDDQVFRLADDSFTRAEQTRQLKALLGDSRYQQYRDYSRSESARNLATDLTSALCYTPTPLAPAQIDQLKNVVLQTLNDGSLGPRYKSAPWILIPAPVWNEILRRAGGVLSAPQVAALADFQQRAMVSQAFGAATKQKP